MAARTTHNPADDLIPLTVNEIRRLFAKLVLTPIRAAGYWLTWSDWRRRHQARAKLSHYRRRQTIDNEPFSTSPCGGEDRKVGRGACAPRGSG
ncbi:hypothetical protein ACQEVC_42455 [Plantactinospora sp. CA-294935]|uniref:hypothetical protein n=1 Tax=Plantactinospora sp. CA-294935 TaxID=3240012 RepID=UPI003D942D72